MPAVKFAISIPKETMARVDGAAKRLGITRSRFIATVLDHVGRRERDAAISAQVDRALLEIEQESADGWLRGRRTEGTEW